MPYGTSQGLNEFAVRNLLVWNTSLCVEFPAPKYSNFCKRRETGCGEGRLA